RPRVAERPARDVRRRSRDPAAASAVPELGGRVGAGAGRRVAALSRGPPRLDVNAVAELTPQVFDDALARVRPVVHHTPLLGSSTLSTLTGFDVRLKAELFQRTGSYKIRGPSNKLPQLPDEQRRNGVI